MAHATALVVLLVLPGAAVGLLPRAMPASRRAEPSGLVAAPHRAPRALRAPPLHAAAAHPLPPTTTSREALHLAASRGDLGGFLSALRLSSAPAPPHLVLRLARELGRRRCPHDALRLLREVLPAQHLEPGRDMLAAVLAAAAEGGLRDEALGVLRELRERGYGLGGDNRLVNTLVAMHVRQGDVRAARELLAAAEAEGVLPDVYSLSALVKGHARRGEVHEARQVLREMRHRGIAPNELTYTSLLTAYATAGMTREAEAVLAEMEEDLVSPNTVHYNVLVNMHARQGHAREALALVSAMRAAGLSPDLHTYTALLNMHASQPTPDFSAVAAVLAEARKDHLRLDATVYNVLARAYHARESEEGLRWVLDQMHEEGIQGDAFPHNALLNLLVVKGRRRETVEAVVQGMVSRGVQPDTVTFNIIMQVPAKEGDVPEVLRLLQEMRRRRLTLDRFSFHNLIGAYSRRGKHVEAWEAIHAMRSAGLEPSASTWKLMARMYTRLGDSRAAADARRRMHSATSDRRGALGASGGGGVGGSRRLRPPSGKRGRGRGRGRLSKH